LRKLSRESGIALVSQAVLPPDDARICVPLAYASVCVTQTAFPVSPRAKGGGGLGGFFNPRLAPALAAIGNPSTESRSLTSIED
jgi:hypothetical protein